MLKCAKMDHSQLVKLVRKMKKELQQMEPSSQGSEGEALEDKAVDSEDGFLFLLDFSLFSCAKF
ncbi:hypothetical protein RHGRI_026050 [Rhododendron griersonianum]|uniref:Uncharacterized protein n=1 Tax=Rhododendron griersonianum TaxID=479676 RepID=A0AAV6IRF4_9ERIC|nr:hypothetical protein RHGRI_026050 [Rhododendron griersonianum]